MVFFIKNFPSHLVKFMGPVWACSVLQTPRVLRTLATSCQGHPASRLFLRHHPGLWVTRATGCPCPKGKRSAGLPLVLCTWLQTSSCSSNPGNELPGPPRQPALSSTSPRSLGDTGNWLPVPEGQEVCRLAPGIVYVVTNLLVFFEPWQRVARATPPAGSFFDITPVFG